MKAIIWHETQSRYADSLFHTTAVATFADNRISAFIFDEATLKHFVKIKGFSQLRVLDETRNHYYIGMAVPTNSPLLEKLNRAMLKVMEKEEWDGLLKKYLNSGSL